ncbi:MAG: hypothetical protein Q7U96_05045 [Chloroflexota bacterium]|nr:hypothetical protein [Chloroflexota bacterium]
MEQLERRVAARSAVAYMTISLTASLAFLSAATLAGTYNDVGRFGGAVWVFLLTIIVSMPLVTSWFKKRHRGS